MLSQTKENIQNLVNKIQVLDFTIDTLGRTHVDCKEEAEKFLKQASIHKLKLIDEILRLSNAIELTQ